ncbi:MAG: ATP-binding protein [Bryobacteraceae bacterium]|nr:ATP-binding protein [Bryobacteraceae bacterium]
MPQYTRPGQVAPFNLAHWIGWWIGAGAAKVGQEVEHLAQRARHSSGSERADWVRRCIIASGVVLSEFALIRLFEPQPDSIPTLIGTWVVIFFLPRPTPRIPLWFARVAAFVATLGALNAYWKIASSSWPALREWDGAFTISWGLLSFGMIVWVFLSFRRKGTSAAVAQVGVADAERQTVARWSNIPSTKFRDVGGCELAKKEIGSIADNRLRVKRNGRVSNGILLYGPQGTGKSLIAEATAGEFQVNFLHVRCPDLVGQVVGATGAEIRAAFESAAANRPVVLFLDEIDSIGSRRQAQGQGTDAGGAGREYNTVTTQLMSAIDKYRSLDGLLIMAATNQLDGLEPTLIREGRFDVKLRLDLPDEAGRKEILGTLLNQFRVRPFDLTDVAKRTPGWSPAKLKALVDRAAEIAGRSPVEGRHLVEALERAGGRDRPQFERVEWDDVVLPEAVVHDLKALIDLMRPGRAQKLSLPAPTGLILTGAPGTGKTLTVRLIATQADRSFYSLSPSDVLSGDVGGSTKKLREAFARAKEHAPSILFFDEMDGLFPNVHGPVSQHDVQLVEQALIEISALKPEHNVFLIGTTNYLDRVDLRILRGGRFSEKIEIGVPNGDGYRKLLSRYLGTARLAESLRVEDLVSRLQGMSPADFEATVTAAKRAAMRRMRSNADVLPPLELADFELALSRVQAHF